MPRYEPEHGGWIPGEDFDPSDPDEMEIMGAVWEGERLDRMAKLERENEQLRLENERLRGSEE